jgi:hypothetical protein
MSNLILCFGCGRGMLRRPRHRDAVGKPFCEQCWQLPSIFVHVAPGDICNCAYFGTGDHTAECAWILHTAEYRRELARREAG